MDLEIRKGIKTFFLNADASLSPDEGQMQGLFLSGYEVYPLPVSRLLPVADQVACLAVLFREIIIFVNIETDVPDGNWPDLLKALAQTHGDKVRLGVFHHESDPKRRADLERYYLSTVRIQAGCIYVDHRRSPDMARLRRILEANEANGRRKAIRMQCSGRMNLMIDKKRVEARVFEISISHFLCIFREGDPFLKEGTRLKDVQLMIGGPVLNVDAAVMIKRVAGHESPDMVYVCGFVRPGTNDLGLDPPQTKILIRLIQNYCTVQINELIQAAYQKRRKVNVLKVAPLAQDAEGA